MNQLISTYRIQFHKEFSFSDLEQILPYLQKLGVGCIYASPVFKAVPGSTHGYDGLNPNEINPEIGSRQQLSAISKQLRAEGIQWLQDIVPNHMAFDPGNEWLMDVLEKGPQSRYAHFFDTAWGSEFFEGRLMVPFLGSSLEEVIDKDELRISYANKGLVFSYYDSHYPLQPLSYQKILSAGENIPEAITEWINGMPKEEEKNAYGEAWHEMKLQLASMMKSENIRNYVDECIMIANQDKELLKEIEAQQSYRLCHWQESDRQMNYRRFFTVNGLICMNIQDADVFEQYHSLVKELLEEGVIQGLRIDHIDGLYDPGNYLHQLKQLAGEEVPIVVEKILEQKEGLPKSWPVQGNTGYDFLALVNNLFTNQNAEKNFSRFYRRLVNDQRSIQEQVREKKSYILNHHMAGELDNLYRLFRQAGVLEKKKLSSIRTEELKEVIGEFLVHCPVYRFYGNRFPLEQEESDGIRNILSQVRKYNPDLRRAIEVFEHTLLERPHEGDEELNGRLENFYKRCMQFSGPLMAKGVEDTLMYTYQRFIAHNEVGDAPAAFGISHEAFHQAMIERQQHWPHSLNATSTHDTKRGEDVRARLNVLTDVAEEWLNTVKEWGFTHSSLDVNDIYFIYQTIVGAHPFPGQEDDFTNRVQVYLEKALREGKIHSNWTSPDEEYEKAAKDFAASLLERSGDFYPRFESFLKTISDHGIVNSLSQLILKFTCPGIPDVYQGCELWDLSLVDPDNRRAVDYTKRNELLGTFNDETAFSLWHHRYDGSIKLWLTQMLFQLRRQHPALFSSGSYVPLEVEGIYKDHVLAFARIYRRQMLVVAVPLHTAVIAREQGVELAGIDWKDTYINLPEGAHEEWDDILRTDKKLYPKRFEAGELFTDLPFAILKGQKAANERGAGILLHVSSLPSAYGIGDMGPEAFAFIDFLQGSGQKYWQLLPLNPIEEGQGHSPYSSISSRAGNILFISPVLLAREGLLDPQGLHRFQLPAEAKTNYAEAERVRSLLFEEAWQNFMKHEQHPLRNEFENFMEAEKDWLDDFALYVLLKSENGGKPWYEWEDAYKFHNPEVLENLQQKESASISKIKWLQFIFSRQWHALKKYANQSGIELIGDLPFYISYDSVDVWANRELFALDESGNRTGLAGVPPDDFSADGQLWGMPVFNWEKHREENYNWWAGRLKKNVELFDIVRLDHFRAFSAYWEVPAGEQTAKNGQWIQGPGASFFEAMQEQLGELPFVAEDLGEIDAPVYELRDQFRLPGMKVLQFAFGNDMNRSVHIPHNYSENFIVYTGTHDNNTTRGWFTQEAGEETLLAIERYAGRPVSSAEINPVLARMAYGSVARIVILPMQDVLNLDGHARMNTPASGENNWGWRLLPGQVGTHAGWQLRNWTWMYNRE